MKSWLPILELEENLAKKSKCDVHKYSALTYTVFIQNMRTKRSINLQIDNQRRLIQQENRQFLKSIVKTVIYLGRNNLPFRGHRDQLKYHAEVGEQSEGQVGVFLNTLNFRVESGDKVLEGHLKNASKNAMYTSAPIQNELIEACGKIILRKLSGEIKKARFFSVIADEASDISRKYQLSLVIRFVDEEEEIREDFVKFIECDEGTSGEHVSNKIIEAVRTDLDVSMEDCRGQGYDAGGNMAGCNIGAATRISNQFPLARYFHCACHRLNLCVEQTCKVKLLEDAMSKVKDMTYFYNNSPKRVQHLERIILSNSTKPAHKQETGLIDVCRTRWVARIEGMSIFENLLPHIRSSLEEMIANTDSWNRDTVISAGNHLK